MYIRGISKKRIAKKIKKVAPPLEKAAERKFAKLVTDNGDKCIKIYEKDWPDRMIILSGGRMFFIEFKRKGKAPRLGQKINHEMLVSKGHRVYVCYSYEEAVDAYKTEKCFHVYPGDSPGYKVSSS